MLGLLQEPKIILVLLSILKLKLALQLRYVKSHSNLLYLDVLLSLSCSCSTVVYSNNTKLVLNLLFADFPEFKNLFFEF